MDKTKKDEKDGMRELCSFYEKDGETVKTDLFSSIAEKVVTDHLKQCTPKPITQTQLRKFYNEVLSIKNSIEGSGSQDEKQKAFKVQIPYIKMLISKVKYSKNRTPSRANQGLVDFIEICIEDINLDDIAKSMEHFNLFVDFFESVVAYSVVHLKK